MVTSGPQDSINFQNASINRVQAPKRRPMVLGNVDSAKSILTNAAALAALESQQKRFYPDTGMNDLMSQLQPQKVDSKYNYLA